MQAEGASPSISVEETLEKKPASQTQSVRVVEEWLSVVENAGHPRHAVANVWRGNGLRTHGEWMIRDTVRSGSSSGGTALVRAKGARNDILHATKISGWALHTCGLPIHNLIFTIGAARACFHANSPGETAR